MKIEIEAAFLIGLAKALRSCEAGLLLGPSPVVVDEAREKPFCTLNAVAESLEILAGARSK